MLWGALKKRTFPITEPATALLTSSFETTCCVPVEASPVAPAAAAASGQRVCVGGWLSRLFFGGFRPPCMQQVPPGAPLQCYSPATYLFMSGMVCTSGVPSCSQWKAHRCLPGKRGVPPLCGSMWSAMVPAPVHHHIGPSSPSPAGEAGRLGCHCRPAHRASLRYLGGHRQLGSWCNRQNGVFVRDGRARGTGKGSGGYRCGEAMCCWLQAKANNSSSSDSTVHSTHSLQSVLPPPTYCLVGYTHIGSKGEVRAKRTPAHYYSLLVVVGACMLPPHTHTQLVRHAGAASSRALGP